MILKPRNLLGRGIFGDSLGALRHSVLGQFTGQQESDCSLDLPAGDGGPLVVVGKAGGLSGDPLKDVVHEGVHDGHSLGGDTGVRVDLLQHLVDVDAVALLPAALLLLITLGDRFLGLSGLFGSLSGGLGWHVDETFVQDNLARLRNLLLYRKHSSASVSLLLACLPIGCVYILFLSCSFLSSYWCVSGPMWCVSGRVFNFGAVQPIIFVRVLTQSEPLNWVYILS